MPIYVNVNGSWQELSGSDRPFVNINNTWQGLSTVHVNVNGIWQQAYQYDIVGPTVPIPTVSSNGSYDSVSWSQITDSGSGVSSAAIYQAFYNVTTNTYENMYSSQVISSSGGSTSFTIPNEKRNSPSGNHYMVYYWITAIDNAGNQTYGDQVGQYSPFINTRPLGTYYFGATAGADSRNISNSAWLNGTVEGIVGVSTTRAYGCWFYGQDVIKNACKGWTANSGSLYVKRAASTDSNRGNTGTFSIRLHDQGTKSGAANFLSTTLTQYLSGNSADAYISLDYDVLSNLTSGAGQGFGLTAHSNIPGFLLGQRDFSGLVTLVYNQ